MASRDVQPYGWVDCVIGGGEVRGVAAWDISFLMFSHDVKRSHTSSFAHSASLRWRISLCLQALKGS
jgi:hypothetical protein